MKPGRRRLAAAALAGLLALATQARPPGVVAEAQGSGPSALASQLAAVTMERPVPARRIVFIGAALHGREDMADQDLAATAHALRELYGPALRTVLLSNVRIAQPPRRLPLATIEHLDDVFEALAEHRRPGDRFIVFLATQGRPHLLEVEQAARYGSPRQITSDKLAAWSALLGGSPQWWVLSACYSGSHLQALAGPQVLAMAAADDDQRSFKCDDRAPRSGFVLAWLEALQQVRAADPRATVAHWWSATHAEVARREQALGLPPSRPQLAGGAQMEGRLHGAIVDF